jgi:hypothetical protein
MEQVYTTRQLGPRTTTEVLVGTDKPCPCFRYTPSDWCILPKLTIRLSHAVRYHRLARKHRRRVLSAVGSRRPLCPADASPLDVSRSPKGLREVTAWKGTGRLWLLWSPGRQRTCRRGPLPQGPS